jgi:uncharacterized repeat protein (TIGR03803 family)
MNNQGQLVKELSRATILVVLLLVGFSANAQTLTVLHSFSNSPDGAAPYLGGSMNLSGNTLYGTTKSGGSFSNGTVFSVNIDGSNFSILHNFTGGSDGAYPPSGLALSGVPGNTLYGTTLRGGTNGTGVIFSLNTNGSNFTVLHTFGAASSLPTPIQPDTITTNVDGACPYGELLGWLGVLYGTTALGGTNASGTIFSLNTDGTDFKVLHSFAANGYALTNRPYGQGTNADGFYSTAGLVNQGEMLFGTTSAGGTNQNGVVFGLNTDGSNFTILHTFSPVKFPLRTNYDGSWPSGLVISGTNLYGVTAGWGGYIGWGTIFSLSTDGNSFTQLHSFFPNTDGAPSLATLVKSGDILYGTTYQNGSSGNGTIFSLNVDGSGFKVIHAFTSSFNNTNTDGAYTTSGLVLSGNVLFGSPQEGGSQGFGTVFALQLPVTVSGIVCNPDSTVSLGFEGTPFQYYLVQATTDLIPPISWETISTNVAGADGSWQFTDTNATYFPSRFYRSALQ